MKFWTHTLVKNGMPFVGLVLNQVAPFAEKMLITISQKSTDATWDVIEKLEKQYPGKLEVDFENVAHPSELTHVRQAQLDKTPYGKWVLFTDDDDYWSTKSLDTIIKHYLNNELDALACNPFQLLNRKYYDLDWKGKWFTKWFRNQPGLHYEKPWPRDILCLNDKFLYWKDNDDVRCIAEPYFHLSNIKYSSFRNEEWAKKYQVKPGEGYFIPEIYKKEVERIYECLK